MLDDYLRQYALLSVFLAVAIAVPVGMLLMSYAASLVRVRPSRTSNIKRSAYEGGMRPFSPRPARFNFRYYYYALLFVVFDVETVLLYPWAVRYGVLSAEFGWAVLGAVLVFLFVVTVAYAYAWRKKALEWT
jgi:NADH-quinone oxidoreductase subunit A